MGFCPTESDRVATYIVRNQQLDREFNFNLIRITLLLIRNLQSQLTSFKFQFSANS